MRYIHLPPASKIAWDQAPQWRTKGKNRGETAKTKTGEQSKPTGGIGRGKATKPPPLLPLPRLPLGSLRYPIMLSPSEIPQPPVFLSCCQFNTTPISQSITIRVAHAQTNRCGAKTAVAQY